MPQGVRLPLEQIQEMVTGIIAGGIDALHQSIENAEDDSTQGWKDIKQHQPDQNDFVIGIAASGTTPYVVGALKKCQENGIATSCITCNPNSPITQHADFPIEVIVGPEFVTGKLANESWNCPKINSKYDYYFKYDQIRKGQRK